MALHPLHDRDPEGAASITVRVPNLHLEASMSFTLPDLPYPHDARSPYMSREALEYHHDKHHAAYVNALNSLIKGTQWEGRPLEDVVVGSFGRNTPLFNNASQNLNHIYFWKWMTPGGSGLIPGGLERQLEADFGSVKKMVDDFVAAGVGQFGPAGVGLHWPTEGLS